MQLSTFGSMISFCHGKLIRPDSGRLFSVLCYKTDLL